MTTDFVAFADPKGKMLYINRAGRRMVGIGDSEDISTMRLAEFVVPEAVDRFVAEALRDALRDGLWSGETRFLHRDGHEIRMSQAIMVQRRDDGEAAFLAMTARDITAEREAAQHLSDAEERFRHAFEDAPVGMAVVLALSEGRGSLLRVNAAFCKLARRDRYTLEPTPLESILHADDFDAVGRMVGEIIRGRAPSLACDARLLRGDGTDVMVSIDASLTVGAHGARQVLLHVQDITERKRFEGQLRHLADHDPLTGLLNRRRFAEELERELSAWRRYLTGGAVLVLDLDNFKYVNDSLGHATGDELIARTGRLLVERLRDSDTIARLGGDEFAVILPRADEQAARGVATTLVETVREAGKVSGGAARQTASVGVALFGHDAPDSASVRDRDDDAPDSASVRDRDDDAPDSASVRNPAGGADVLTGEDLLVQADIAMYNAKDAGRDRIAVFDPARGRQRGMEARLTWADRIRDAIDSDRLVLCAQPILALTGDDVPRHELLVRIRDERGALIPAANFLDVAERFELVQAIDRWVLGEAIQLLGDDQRSGGASFQVNLSAKSIVDPALPDLIASALGASGADGRRLVLEVTETAAVVNFDRAQRLARRMADLGAAVALDDFGVGFASFSYLRHLDFDYLKIDGEFVTDLPASPVNQLIVRAVVDVARGLGGRTVAECVESEETLDLVRRLGVDHAQGFHIAEPTPVDEVDLARPVLTA